jgi:hypothetical protein
MKSSPSPLARLHVLKKSPTPLKVQRISKNTQSLIKEESKEKFVTTINEIQRALSKRQPLLQTSLNKTISVNDMQGEETKQY